MKRHNFDLIRAEEELAGARQCAICLALLVALNLTAALAYKFDVMTTWMLWVWLIGSLTLASAALICALIPEIRARKLERDMWHEDNGSYVQPHQ